MGSIDLHTHSLLSDGTDSVYELVKKAQKSKIKYLAVTDHNSIDSALEVKNYCSESLEILTGAEFTAATTKGKLHLLGYQFDPRNKDLVAMTDKIQSLCLTKTYDIMECLKKDYEIIFPETELYRLVGQRGDIGTNYIAGLCVNYGYVETIEEAKLKYLRKINKQFPNDKYRLLPEEIIETVHRAGGVVSLAHHNTLSRNYDQLDQLVEYLKWYGLDSIEVNHSTFHRNDRVIAEELAHKYKLLKSVGSDYHGTKKPEIVLGDGKGHNIRDNKCTIVKALIEKGKVKKI